MTKRNVSYIGLIVCFLTGSQAEANPVKISGQACTGTTAAARADMVYNSSTLGEHGIRNGGSARRGVHCGAMTQNAAEGQVWRPSATIYVEDWDASNPMVCELKVRAPNGATYYTGTASAPTTGANQTITTGSLGSMWFTGNVYIWCGVPGTVGGARSGIRGWKLTENI